MVHMITMLVHTIDDTNTYEYNCTIKGAAIFIVNYKGCNVGDMNHQRNAYCAIGGVNSADCAISGPNSTNYAICGANSTDCAI